MAHFSLGEKGEFQNSDWSKRPLTPAQLDYAANDTYFLAHIANKQIEQVIQTKSPEDIEDFLKKFNSKVQEACYQLKS